MSESSRAATDSLVAHVGGDPRAADRLIPLVYSELRALAATYMERERPDHSLTPTAIVHEAYLRLIDQTRTDWRGRTHFKAIAALQMRRVLIDHARGHDAQKRGRDWLRISLDETLTAQPGANLDLLALSEALEQLATRSERQASVVELRFFGGLDVREVAHYLDISERTVKQDWRIARAWLRRALSK